MPVFLLDDRLNFPPPDFSESEGLLAVGGDLSRERLMLAYRSGIFPWYNEGDRILWWSPASRAVISPESFRISKSFSRTLKKGAFEVKIDVDFESVIRACARVKRKDQDSTWILEEMIEAYVGLHRAGNAHSFEVYYEGALAGGLYGVSAGGCFFGESMFHFQSDASKIAVASLLAFCRGHGFGLVDCQLTNAFLCRLGAHSIPREEYLKRLGHSLLLPEPAVPWAEIEVAPLLDDFVESKTRSSVSVLPL